MAADTLHDRVLRWSNELLAAVSIAELSAVLARPPAEDDEALTANLVLLDSGHELRHLAAGDHPAANAPGQLRFVESLAGVTPHYDALHAPWCGSYQAADHGLLFAPQLACTHVALLPLPRERMVAGVYNIAGRGASPRIAALEGPWLEHLAGQVAASVERVFHRARLLRSGVVDPLTGWNSRLYFHARLREELARCQRTGRPATCLVVDVDGLRGINEQHGVSAGDAALSEVGARIEAQVRASDAAAHLGSDSFAILLPATAPALAAPLVERILATVRFAPVPLGPDLAVPVTVSIGIAGADVGTPEGDRKAAADQWLAEAETAMHRAKRAGGDRAVLSSYGVTATAGKQARPRRP
jgi:diguanylate cyclase (GGDEF)-like protein